jgi:aminoglycoside phosphotransferase (APT) family kinase protein
VARREPEARENFPHGFDLSAADERLLRGPVPTRALRWAAAAVAAEAAVVSCRALAGGTSSAVHELEVIGVAGRHHRLVLRRFVRLDWLAEEPDVARHEAAALTAAAPAHLPTPTLVASDPDGAAAGVPAVLMTMLDGQIEWDPPELEDFLRRLARALELIHRLPVPADGSLPPYRPYAVRLRRPPAWARDPDVWLRAVALAKCPVPSAERTLIHRDYHPGNVLWRDRRVTGVVDWVNASVGSRWADVGHCRMNLARRFGQPAAERFLSLYRAATARDDDYSPYWDVAAALGGFDEASGGLDLGDERFLAAALSRL